MFVIMLIECCRQTSYFSRRRHQNASVSKIQCSVGAYKFLIFVVAHSLCVRALGRSRLIVNFYSRIGAFSSSHLMSTTLTPL